MSRDKGKEKTQKIKKERKAKEERKTKTPE